MELDNYDPEAGQRNLPLSGFGHTLHLVTRWFAIAGGLLLLIVVLITAASVAGRYFFSTPIPGDYEITEFGCGVAILLFFPFCEMTLGNIKAEFFTHSLASRWKRLLDFISEIAFTLVACLLAWRFVIGGMKRFADGQVYMHLDIPYWWGYVPGVTAMVLLIIVCLWRSYDLFEGMRFKA